MDVLSVALPAVPIALRRLQTAEQRSSLERHRTVRIEVGCPQCNVAAL